MTTPVPPRVRLQGYIHGTTGWVPRAHEGYVDFAYVFTYRPPECRYAIVEIIPEEYLVVDLFAAQITEALRLVAVPAPGFATLDTAIAAAMLCYEHPVG